MCKNLKLIALAIDKNFSAFINIFSLSPLGKGIFTRRQTSSSHFPALNFIIRQQLGF
jgi:hypothetical protein